MTPQKVGRVALPLTHGKIAAKPRVLRLRPARSGLVRQAAVERTRLVRYAAQRRSVSSTPAPLELEAEKPSR